MMATEDIIFLCDQDDIWEPEKVASLLSLFEKYEPDMVFSDGSLVDQFGKDMQRPSVLHSYGLTRDQVSSFHENAFERLLKRNYINGAASAVRRTTAQNALPLPCEMPHDFWLAIWCSLHKGIVGTPEKLYRYRQHQDSVIGMGGSNMLYLWLGIWRHPRQPRERDLRIWKAVTERISILETESASRIPTACMKVAWLTRILSEDNGVLKKFFEILKSTLAGNYRRYSAGNAFLRDMISLFR